MTDTNNKTPLQSQFPLLWLAAQYLLCGYFDRGKLIDRHYAGQRRVLEVGCSQGIDSMHFTKKPCEYLGVDIDPLAIENARKRYARYPHMRFSCADLTGLALDEGSFDFIMFCGVCHHVPDETLAPLMEKAARLLADDGVFVVIDYALPDKPGWFEKFILMLEEGRYVRPRHEFMELIGSVRGLRIAETEIHKNAAFLGPWPTMAHKYLIRMEKDSGSRP